MINFYKNIHLKTLNVKTNVPSNKFISLNMGINFSNIIFHKNVKVLCLYIQMCMCVNIGLEINSRYLLPKGGKHSKFLKFLK